MSAATPAPSISTPPVADQSKLMESTKDTATKISAFLLGELNSSTEDYKLLEQMNSVTAKKYSEMAENAESLTQFMKQLKEKYESFQPFLEKIDQIEVGIQSLEDTVMQLDEYSKRLESKYKQISNI